MPSTALAAALADIDTVFNGFASPHETGCALCHLPEETTYLRTPYTRVPPDVLRMYVFEGPGHFDDHAASMRRLLPQTAHAIADGTLDGIGWGVPGLARVAWRTWPAEQAAAIEAFVLAWWQDTLATPTPPYPVAYTFETCALILDSLAPLLERWEPGPVADAHLADCAARWESELVFDELPFSWWVPDDEPAVLAALQAWLAARAPACLRTAGRPDLALRAELLALPHDARWAHPYWYAPSAAD
ncbi:hypothetical protein ABZ490_31145 [Streptomyces sp. NPDC005811]|uniref:hypothetical protein n=1 Tax=Streptomyces sp. NPDC005811 TaxID=3154565 RepID=UPI0033D0FC29